MRKYFLPFIVAATITACGNKTSNNNESADSTNAVSATAGDEVKADNIKPDDFTSPDLAYFNVHGPVHKLFAFGSTYEFDEDGKLIKMDDYDPFKESERIYDEETCQFEETTCYKRDAKGRISETYGLESFSEIIWENDHLAREEGQVEGTEFTYHYSYDKNGDLVKMIAEYRSVGYNDEEGDDEYYEKVETKYTIRKHDAHGNWTLRTDEEGNEAKRQILYYGESEKTLTGPASLHLERDTYHMTGSIGGDKNATLNLSNGEGDYTISIGTRLLKVYRYHPSDGTLLIKAYQKSNNKFLGYFQGTCDYTDGIITYKGQFYNQDFNSVDFNLKCEK